MNRDSRTAFVQGGNRSAGYGWALAERGDYLYIGTWNNIGGQILNSFVLPRLNQYGDNTDLFWAISDILTNGDIPRDDVVRGGEIIRMNKNNPGDFETLPENEGLKITVKQVNTSDGSNSKVDNGVIL